MSSIKDRVRGFVDPRPAQQRPHHVRTGLIVILVGTVALIVALKHDIPFVGNGAGIVQADFPYANQVGTNGHTPVRVGGVDVGVAKQVGPGPDPRRSSRVTMRITTPGLVVHSDARAEIRWRTVLGGSMFIDLQPGSPSAPKLGNRVIPLSRTSSQAEFDDVLRTYNRGTDENQRRLLKGLSKGTADPRATGSAVDALPAIKPTGEGLDAIRGQQSDDLRGIVRATGTVAKSLGADTVALQHLVTGADNTLGATDARRAELARSLDQSPPSLDSTIVTMNRLRTTLGHLDPTVQALRPGAREIASSAKATAPALDQTRAVLHEAKPLLRNAKPTFDSLRRLSLSGVPLIKGLDPTVRRLNADILPFLNERDLETRVRNYQSLGPFFSDVDSAASQYDAAGFRLRLGVIPEGSNSVTTFSTPGNGGNLQSRSSKPDDVMNSTAGRVARHCVAVVAANRRDRCAGLAELVVNGLFGYRKGK